MPKKVSTNLLLASVLGSWYHQRVPAHRPVGIWSPRASSTSMAAPSSNRKGLFILNRPDWLPWRTRLIRSLLKVLLQMASAFVPCRAVM